VKPEVRISGAHALAVEAGASIAPSRWAAKEARLARMDRLCALSLVACNGALVDAGLSPTAAWDGDRTAITLGTAFGCHATNEDYYRGLCKEGITGASPRLFAYTLPSSPVGEISIHYGIRGPAMTLTNGLTSAIDALAAAASLIENGRADRALVVAADVATPLLGRIEGAPPYDTAAALVVERADLAARSVARVCATAAAFDAGDPTAAAGDAAARARSGMFADAIGSFAGPFAAAPLAALIDWLRAGAGAATGLVSVADPSGAASAALVRRNG
jgi:3-oxoacyl-[acyl-carrier-protein] synthase II